MMTKTMHSTRTKSPARRVGNANSGRGRRALPDTRVRRLHAGLGHLAADAASWASTDFDPQDQRELLDPEFDDLGGDAADFLRGVRLAASHYDGDVW